MPPSTTSVLVVDDNNTFADAMRFAIERHPDLCCVGIAHDASSAHDCIRRDAPDHALINLDLTSADGLETTRMLRQAAPDMGVTVLTSRTDPETMQAAELAGASHFIPKQSSMADVLDALRSPHGGRMMLPGAMVIDMMRRFDQQPVRDADGLTARELDVLRGMAEGLPPKTIAQGMGISVHTVRGHVKNIYWKLDAHSQLEAVAIARRRGLVSVAS